MLHKLDRLSCDMLPHRTICLYDFVHVLHLVQSINRHLVHFYALSLQAISELHLRFVQNV
jgi:hypothetical protein